MFKHILLPISILGLLVLLGTILVGNILESINDSGGFKAVVEEVWNGKQP